MSEPRCVDIAREIIELHEHCERLESRLQVLTVLTAVHTACAGPLLLERSMPRSVREFIVGCVERREIELVYGDDKLVAWWVTPAVSTAEITMESVFARAEQLGVKLEVEA